MVSLQLSRIMMTTERDIQDVLRAALKAIEENHQHHIDYHGKAVYQGSGLEQTNLEAIALIEAELG